MRQGGVNVRPFPPQGFDLLTNQMVSLLVLFSNINFRSTIHKIFIKLSSAPTYANFEKDRAPRKCKFFVKSFQKVIRNGVFEASFSKICLRNNFFVKIGVSLCSGRARKINVADLIKRSTKISKYF